MRCPGQDPRYWTAESVFETLCPECGISVEFFKDDSSRRCPGCGQAIRNPKLDLGCAEWCPYVEECLGITPEQTTPAVGQEGQLAGRLIQAMKSVFGKDQRRIGHALTVFQHAKELVRKESTDPRVVIPAAILHDIGIHEAERKHGSSAPRFQELEGPPIARKIMEALGVDAEIVEHVCRIIANHHTGKEIDTPEFRIVWDADWLVNLPDVHPNAGADKLAGIIDRVFKTKAGREKARRLFPAE